VRCGLSSLLACLLSASSGCSPWCSVATSASTVSAAAAALSAVTTVSSVFAVAAVASLLLELEHLIGSDLLLGRLLGFLGLLALLLLGHGKQSLLLLLDHRVLLPCSALFSLASLSWGRQRCNGLLLLLVELVHSSDLGLVGLGGSSGSLGSVGGWSLGGSLLSFLLGVELSGSLSTFDALSGLILNGSPSTLASTSLGNLLSSSGARATVVLALAGSSVLVSRLSSLVTAVGAGSSALVAGQVLSGSATCSGLSLTGERVLSALLGCVAITRRSGPVWAVLTRGTISAGRSVFAWAVVPRRTVTTRGSVLTWTVVARWAVSAGRSVLTWAIVAWSVIAGSVGSWTSLTVEVSVLVISLSLRLATLSSASWLRVGRG